MSKRATTSKHAAGDKGSAWYTAFFFLAEHFREATNSALNHKVVYSLISSEGHYINHENPVIRKGAAGTLSRIIHSKLYAKCMRDAYFSDETTFETAAAHMCSSVRKARCFNDAELRAWLVDECWPDVRQGLANEAEEWRMDLDALRLDCEMTMLLDFRDEKGSLIDAESMLSEILHVMAFGHLDVETSRMLVDAQSKELPLPVSDSGADTDSTRACLVRFVDLTRSVLSGFWVIQDGEPFKIGRYTDCNAIEVSPSMTSIHCRIIWKDDAWLLESVAPKSNIEVRRCGACVYSLDDDAGDTNLETSYGAREESQNAFRLEFGDEIELPSGSVYLLAAMDDLGQF